MSSRYALDALDNPSVPSITIAPFVLLFYKYMLLGVKGQTFSAPATLVFTNDPMTNTLENSHVIPRRNRLTCHRCGGIILAERKQGSRHKREAEEMTKGIERISEWVMKNVKEDDIRFMAERWDDHMAGAHKFEALYNVQDLYEMFKEEIWNKIRDDARLTGEELMPVLADILEPFIVFDEASMHKGMALYVIGVAIFGVAEQMGLIEF